MNRRWVALHLVSASAVFSWNRTVMGVLGAWASLGTLVLSLVVATSMAAPAGQGEGLRIEQLAWLSGCWELTLPERTVEEHWLAPRGQAMIGVSRTVRDGRMTEYRDGRSSGPGRSVCVRSASFRPACRRVPGWISLSAGSVPVRRLVVRGWMCSLTGISAFVWFGGVGVVPMMAEEPVVPVYHEPHHRQVFQYGPTRILDVQVPPGDTSWYHTHDSPILYVTLSAGQIRTQNLGQDWGAGGRGRGQTPNANAATTPNPPPRADTNAAGSSAARLSSSTTYAEHPVTHRVQNVGDRLFRPIGVINESAGDDTMTEQAAGFDGKPELTNRWFRAYRFTLAAGESTPSHRHKTPVVLIQTTEGHAVGAGAMKFELNEPGRWAFFDASDAHQIRNTGDARVELIEVEVRQPAR